MPEDVLISVLQGHFSSSHPTGTGVSVPTLQGKLRHWGGMICSWSHLPTAGEKQWQARFLGAVGTTQGVPVPCDHQTLGCGWKRSLGEAFVVPQERKLLTIMLSDFLIISRAAKPLSYPQNTARAGAGPSLAEQHSRAQRSGQFPAGLHHTTNQGKQNVLFQASFFFPLIKPTRGCFATVLVWFCPQTLQNNPAAVLAQQPPRLPED